MLILALRTDKPEAEIGLFDGTNEISYQTWQAHRQLAETVHTKVADMLKVQGKELRDLAGIVCYKGPGSFTGLRIGLSAANGLAYGLGVPIVGRTGEGWVEDALESTIDGADDRAVMPEYGAPVHITTPRK
jgi:tRNA threonylcarbamoyladenosine biosynthesis protein TsaB